jgi:hypothetical protein
MEQAGFTRNPARAQKSNTPVFGGLANFKLRLYSLAFHGVFWRQTTVDLKIQLNHVYARAVVPDNRLGRFWPPAGAEDSTTNRHRLIPHRKKFSCRH